MAECVAGSVEKLLAFGQAHGLVEGLDVVGARNALLDTLGIAEPAAPYTDELPPTATPILAELVDYAVAKGLIGETGTERELFDTRLMGLLMPRPNETIARFSAIRDAQGVQAATDWFYNLGRMSNYIRVDQVARNILWPHESPYGTLEITINLSKPEKDPAEIAKLKNAPSSGYPACQLCVENLGYAGRLNHPPRQTLRFIPMTFGDEQWYFQYSPYVYYREHCIVFKGEHVPMRITRDTFRRLLSFVGQFPHYFLGSNADLPIVGGSILNHDHFQGGAHILPMAKAGIQIPLAVEDHPEVEAGIVHWPMSAVRLTGKDPDVLEELANRVLEAWRAYSDPACDILAETQGAPHNTITPICRRRGEAYELDLVLRNNRTSDEHPMGIFHPHAPWHHIQRENIGLIEVMGLFILPGRLKNELSGIEDLLCGKAPFDSATRFQLAQESHPLNKHLPWIEELLGKYGMGLSPEQAHAAIEREVGDICTHVLEDAGVYKDTSEGREGMLRFLATCGIQRS